MKADMPHFLDRPMDVFPFLFYLDRSSAYTYSQVSQVALVVKNLLPSAVDVRDAGLIPGSGISPRVGNGNLLQYS